MNVRLFSLWQSTLVTAFTPSSPLPSLFLPCTSGQSPWSVGRGPQGEILWVFGGSWWRWWWRVGSEAAPPSPHRMSLHSALSHRSSQLEQELRENISQLKSTIEMWEKGYPCGLVWSSVLLYDRYRRELVEWEEVIEKEKVEAQQFIKYACVGSTQFGELQKVPEHGCTFSCHCWVLFKIFAILASEIWKRRGLWTFSTWDQRM